ncbi:uncharacterized protein J4E87_008257 [Alternaria ethzedia]|uniref:uncharacterized protein n=2 Tax=Alternaria sect. Infectoriae TaxID=2499258 RepID=UPI0020C2D236|nr:uncharacterized protein J4E87_008257 [Alternaria ethzedia]KAI4617621.1 hypothetical protein J4E87_008257 [Alternaria ethzedia]
MYKMHFSTAITTLSAFAVMSASVSAFQADFDTWDVRGCMGSGEPGRLNHYPTVNKDVCGDLPNAASIRVNYLEGNCQVNLYSGDRCTGDFTVYKKEPNYNQSCKNVDGKVSYKVTC